MIYSPVRLVLGALLLCLSACTQTNQTAETDMDATEKIFYWQGHRGARGLLPENTIPGMEKALALGMNTLEMDVAITADRQVVLSHEPFLNHEICSDANGQPIPATEERNYNIFRMSYEQLQAYDCGSKAHPRFAGQQLMPLRKPLLKEVIAAAEQHARTLNLPAPYYNIEIKSMPEGDGVFHPEPAEFVKLVMEQIEQAGIGKRTFVQSFDVRPLQYLRQHHPGQQLALLVENPDGGQANIDRLGFVPECYSPYFEFVTEELVSWCHRQNMLLIPWTVNQPDDMERLLTLGVDGIITDYPDRARPLMLARRQQP